MSKRSHDLKKNRSKLSKDDPNYSSDESDYFDDKPAQSIDFSRIWLTVRSKPHDFTSWCSLLQLAEQENKLGLIRKAFNEFFKHYPYCYAYWKKYCDLERRHGHNYHAKRVVKRGLEVNEMSVDLWIYCIELYSSRYMAEYQHMQSKRRRDAEKAKKAKRDKDENDPEFDEDGNPIIKEDDDDDENQDQAAKSDEEPDLDEIYAGKDANTATKFYDDGHSSGQLSQLRVEKLRKLYWKAVAACGKQFKCGRLWNKFVYFERQNGNLDKVLPIYNEILRIPMEDYNKQFTEMKEFVQDSADPSELIEDEELRTICKELLEDKNANLGIGDQGDQAYRLAKAGELSEDALDQIRKGIVDKRRELFKENEKKVARVWNFEDNIKRPYFHVKPLDKGQLRNWIEYLDYEVDSGTPEHVVKNLFERCLVTTALYEDFWLKYANWAEYKSKNIELARSCYRRCCEVHLPKRANCRIEWATFEERHGELEKSRLILEDLNTMKRVTQENKGFLNAPDSRGPTIQTNVPSQRVADYSEVGGNYQTYQSSGAYGNSYTWQYNKSGK